MPRPEAETSIRAVRPLTVDIPADVRSLLAQLELLSHGSTQAWNSGGRHGDQIAALPFGERFPPHDEFRRRYLEADADKERAAVVDDMRTALQAARGQVDRSHVVGETSEEEDARIVREGRGFTAAEVARHFNCTPTRVRAVRLAAGHDAKYGHPPKGSTPLADADPAAEARRLRDQGMTQRQIALALRLPKSTIGRWLASTTTRNRRGEATFDAGDSVDALL